MPSPSVRLMVLALLSGTPTLAHAATTERPLPPPPAPMTAAYLTPFAPQQRMNWLNECHNRLTRSENPNFAAIDQGCEAWLRYYESGGAPDPTYGYVVPVEVSGGMECIPCPPPARPRLHRRVVHDKRIKL